MTTLLTISIVKSLLWFGIICAIIVYLITLSTIGRVLVEMFIEWIKSKKK